MVIIACKMINPEYQQIQWDFLYETGRSYGATVLDKDKVVLPEPKSTIIALRHGIGGSIEDFKDIKIDTILIGYDDSTNDWLEQYQAVTIETPTNHCLWSAVALGIILNHLHISSHK